MKIISCMKPVPDPTSRLLINETKTWIRDQDLTFVASEADNYALEEALRIKEKNGGEVVVLSMGGEESARVLRSGLAMGADRAIHLLDPKFKGADEFAAAMTLAKAIQKDGGADLVLTGVQSDDLGTGMTGTMYEVKEIFIPEKKSKVEILSGTPEEAAAALVEKLKKEAKVI